MEPIILASTSPQRQEIVKNLHIPFIVVPPEIDESITIQMPPQKMVEVIAQKKAQAVVDMSLTSKPHWIISADTLIFFDGLPVGKPKDEAHARVMLQNYSNTSHEVITSVCCYDDVTKHFSSKTHISTVSFSTVTPAEIDWYIGLGEWQGAAGGYRIQGAGACFIENINGSYSSIVGLPIYELYAILKEHDYQFQ